MNTSKTPAKTSEKFSVRKLLFPYDYKKDHFKALDGLRGVAVLLVILSHASLHKVYLFPGLDFSGMGKPGVFLFFVLSAYLLDRQIIVGFVNGKANAQILGELFFAPFFKNISIVFYCIIVFYGCSNLVLKAY